LGFLWGRLGHVLLLALGLGVLLLLAVSLLVVVVLVRLLVVLTLRVLATEWSGVTEVRHWLLHQVRWDLTVPWHAHAVGVLWLG